MNYKRCEKSWGIKPVERLTRHQMEEKYPSQWLGIRNIKYGDADKRIMESAEVVYTDKTASELASMAIKGDDIIPWHTNKDDYPMGFISLYFTKEV